MKRFHAPDLSIDMTPMIDCTFQLITFFMLVINFENSAADERIKLPESALARPSAAVIEDQILLQLAVRRDDGPKENLAGENAPQHVANGVDDVIVLYANEELPLSALEERMARERRFYRLNKPEGPVETTIVIRADSRAPTGIVQELIRICQKQGFENFLLKAREKAE